MPYRSPARYLAPLALVGAFLILIVVYVGTFGGDDEPAAPSSPAGSPDSPATGTTATTATSATTTTATTAADGEGGRTYTVQSGDILSTIAQEQGVTVERLLELNPDVDPQGLQAGDELRIGP